MDTLQYGVPIVLGVVSGRIEGRSKSLTLVLDTTNYLIARDSANNLSKWYSASLGSSESVNVPRMMDLVTG